jgi:hypothetical protein
MRETELNQARSYPKLSKKRREGGSHGGRECREGVVDLRAIVDGSPGVSRREEKRFRPLKRVKVTALSLKKRGSKVWY